MLEPLDTITLRELTIRYEPRRDCADLPTGLGSRLENAEAAGTLFRRILRDEPNEVAGMLCLDARNRVIAYHEISRGALDATLMNPRDVFKVALLANAAAIVVAHNHPSGDPTPSAEDCRLTARLVAGGKLIGISVIDHLIIGEARNYGFAQAGLL
ncbi:MAG: JAB domain-containing protein [Rhodospirillaceae bacterium]